MKDFIEINKEFETPEVFIEDTLTLYYSKIEYAKLYINIYSLDIDNEIRDEILEDFINTPMIKYLDMLIKKEDLYKKIKRCKYLEPNILINELFYDCAWELFINKPNDTIDINLRARILLDYLNYVTKLNGYSKVFTLKDLYEKAKKEKHLLDLKILKEFLIESNKYTIEFEKGKKVDDVIKEMLSLHNISNITNEELKQNDVLDEMICSVLYGYEKANKKIETKNEFIKQKINDMKTR